MELCGGVRVPVLVASIAVVSSIGIVAVADPFAVAATFTAQAPFDSCTLRASGGRWQRADAPATLVSRR